MPRTFHAPLRFGRAAFPRILAFLGIAAGALALGSAPGSVPEEASTGDAPVIPQHALHGMSAEDMARWVREFYATHPMRGARSLDVAVDTFLATGDFRFDADDDPSTAVDTVRIVQGQTVMWRNVAGTHSTTSGEDFNDPSLGLLWDQPLSPTDSTFAFRFDSPGIFPFFCRPHLFFGMKGVVAVTPIGGPDVTPPQVQLLLPNGSESFPAHLPAMVTWQATDDQGVTAIDLFYRDGEGEPWVTLGRELPNTGTFQWFVHNTPSAAARVRVVARDDAGNAASDSSDGVFTIVRVPGGRVATTLRDFIQPGTQPLDVGEVFPSQLCLSCHGGYQADVEPGAWKGTMMANAGRDPLFYACLAIAEQDAPASGDLCIRCHAAVGWLNGHSVPTDGSRLTADDRDGVNCALCHRMVDPIYQPGVSPPSDQAILNGLLPAHRPTGHSNGQYVIDPDVNMRRGPFSDAAAPHPSLESNFHRRSDLCATCHDVSNPVFIRTAGADYAPGPLDQRTDSLGVHGVMPIERTFSEWQNSAFPAGVFSPTFAGSKPDGIVSICQDCHERDVVGQGCDPQRFPNAPTRSNLPFHDMTGGNAWMPMALGLSNLYPGEIDPAAQLQAAHRATEMLRKAATMEVIQGPAPDDSHFVQVKITNHTGHKLPTGYPEGRRMWLEVRVRDANGAIIYHSGAYEAATATLTEDPHAVVYEKHLGLSPAWAAQLGLPAGPSFHFVLNDTVYKDNRIPPLGFTIAAFEKFGGAPVDPGRSDQPPYVDGQNWDIATYVVPPNARSAAVTLKYQSASREYIEFLRDENTTNDAGQQLYDLWSAHGKSEPVVMAYDSIGISAPAPGPSHISLRAMTNPFRRTLNLELALPASAPVVLEIFDARGRRLSTRNYGVLGPGLHVLTWDGDDRHGARAGAGSFWARVKAGNQHLRQQVVRIE
ncbi:MAG TPA: FlgD immunoglobulin-like domain containing protein [Candidatus Eisenbacteria bacterium]|nr:FlgD immunoglobulin-like domain containing protein [Candidatus Eisenbacteria bacterium]